MSDVLAYLLEQYVILFVFVFACWGTGRFALQSLGIDSLQISISYRSNLLNPLATAFGVAIAACGLQWLAVIGHLQKGPVLILLMVGLILTTRFLMTKRDGLRRSPGLRSWSRNEQAAFVVMLLIAFPTFFAPLAPPLDWDELMYHLPHARQWANSGSLTVDLWLRYPWFPYNYDLLYSAALIFHNDVFTHILHAMAGWIVAWLLFEFGSAYIDRLSGLLTAACWLYLSRGYYKSAYIDMGLTLWLTAGFIAFWLGWQEERKNARIWWIVSAFCLGAATGTKYQVIGVLPFFVIAMVWKAPRLREWLTIALVFALPCAYWYIRNLIFAGDPVAPIGGKIFGFTDWNLYDYQGQFANLHRHLGWPPVILWAVPFTFIAASARRNATLLAVTIFVGFQFAVWVVTSRYTRYLLPAYPLFALLAVQGWRVIAQQAWIHFSKWNKSILFGQYIFAFLFVALCTASVYKAYINIRKIAPTPSSREAYLQAHIPGYGVIEYLKTHQVGKLYQFGMEGVIYYLPNPVWGEEFGPWRYVDYANLGAKKLHDRLLGEGFTSLLIHTVRFSSVVSKSDFNKYFQHVITDGPVTLYRIYPTIRP